MSLSLSLSLSLYLSVYLYLALSLSSSLFFSFCLSYLVQCTIMSIAPFGRLETFSCAASHNVSLYFAVSIFHLLTLPLCMSLSRCIFLYLTLSLLDSL